VDQLGDKIRRAIGIADAIERLRRKLSAFSHRPSALRLASYRRLSAFIGGLYGFSRMSDRPASATKPLEIVAPRKEFEV
jgi:hypothetical protein